MGSYTVRQEHVVFNNDVTCQCNLVRKNVVVANLTIVCDVNANHKEVSRADVRGEALAIRAVKSRKLSNEVVIADHQATCLTFEFNVLRFAAKYSMFVNLVSRTQFRIPLDHSVSANLAVFSDDYVVLNNDVRPNPDVWTNLSCRRDNSGRRDQSGRHNI